MKNLITIFSLLVFATSAMGAYIKDDTLKIGKPGSSASKVLKLGNSGAIKYNSSTSKLQFSHDGTIFKNVGSGGGGSGGGINLLTDNPDAEAGSGNWTASGGTYTTTSTAANVYDGLNSFSFTPAGANQTVTSDAYASTAAMQGNNGCSAVFYYQTSEATNLYIATVQTGSTVLGTLTLPTATIYTPASIPFPCQNVGTTVKIVIAAAAVLPTQPIYWDDAFLGIGFNTSQVSQARWIGSVSYAPTASCVWTGSSTTTPANFAAQSSCPTPTASGAISVPATKIPGFTLPSGGPGIYRIVAKSSFRVTGNENCGFRFSDGTNSTVIAQVSGQVSAQTVSSPMIEGEFNYSTAPAGNTTIQIQSSCGTTGTDAQILDSQTNQSGFEVSVYYFPSGQETAVRADASSLSWSGASTLSATTTSASYGVISTSLTGAVTTTASKNLTCTAASGSLGVTCALPRLGSYQVCFSGSFGNSAAGPINGVKLVDGSGNAITGEQLFYQPPSTAGYYSPMGACGNYTATALSTTFQLYGKVSGSTGSFLPTSFSVVAIDGGSANMQVFKGLVTSAGSGQVRTGSGRFTCSNSAAAIIAQDGGFTSIANGGSTGLCTLNITAAGCSSTPYEISCSAGASASNGRVCTYDTSAISATSIAVQRSSLGTGENGEISVGFRCAK